MYDKDWKKEDDKIAVLEVQLAGKENDSKVLLTGEMPNSEDPFEVPFFFKWSIFDGKPPPAPACTLVLMKLKAFKVPDVDSSAGSGDSDPYVVITLLEGGQE